MEETTSSRYVGLSGGLCSLNERLDKYPQRFLALMFRNSLEALPLNNFSYSGTQKKGVSGQKSLSAKRCFVPAALRCFCTRVKNVDHAFLGHENWTIIPSHLCLGAAVTSDFEASLNDGQFFCLIFFGVNLHLRELEGLKGAPPALTFRAAPGS